MKRVINKKDLNQKFIIEENHNNNFSLSKSDLMISDWSGASTEFAFALERPVLFIDTIKKLTIKGGSIMICLV